MIFLKELYKVSKGNVRESIKPKELEFYNETVQKYLIEKGFIKNGCVMNTISITALGMDTVEDSN